MSTSSPERCSDQETIPTRVERLMSVLEGLQAYPPASSGLEAYAQLAEIINNTEDEIWGSEAWDLPRTFLDGQRTDRLYPILPESFHPVHGYPGVTILVSKIEVVFISRWGAIEMQRKDPEDKFGERVHFAYRSDRVLFTKPDAYGDHVWHDKNRF